MNSYQSKNNPLISIIMPVRNNEKYFPIAVQTILDQQFTDWELIIMEGISVDKTADIADNFVKIDSRIKVVHTGEWIYEKVNLGISISSGKYYMVVNSDDKLAPNALSIISYHLLKHDVDMFLIASGSVLCDANQNEISNDFSEVEKKIPHELVILNQISLKNEWVKLLSSGLLNNQINVYKIDLVKDIRFRNDVFGADYLYNLDILPFIRSVAYVSKCLYYFHIYCNTDGLNTSVGKFYDYTHIMFNDFYYKGLNMFINHHIIDHSVLNYLKKRRYLEFINSELTMYKFKSNNLSLNETLMQIFNQAAEIKNLINDEEITSGLDDNVLTASYELLNIRSGEIVKEMLPIADGLFEMFAINDKNIQNINLELIKNMVYNYYNPGHIGIELYNNLVNALN